MRRIGQVSFLALVLAMAGSHSEAQVQIDKHRAVPGPDPLVRIENAFGTIRVVVWDKNEVWVKGTLAASAEGLGFDAEPWDDEDEEENGKKTKVRRMAVDVRVSVPDSWSFESDDDSDYRSTLEISVPRDASLEIESTNAPITVNGPSGSMSIESVNGTVQVTGGAHEIELKSLTGEVVYTGPATSVHVETVSGGVRLELQNAEAHVRTVKGSVVLRGKTLSEVAIETTAGNVTLESAIAPAGEWGIETFSGNVALTFPGAATGHFQFKTAEGQITSNVGPKPRRTERFQPFRVLEFRAGSVESSVEVETYSGGITLKAAAAPATASTKGEL
ncbi:MAG TPA: DUF4097 family beta strand repeat-containing protein [Candidatus Polarisedimenticolaceae bacterium]|nr:DUF4097 family beta strand repeat-containing protein [Candidatus Polarisedimenticolaceae bacterium]